MKLEKILIGDDNHDLADGLAMVLEDEDYHVSVVYNGTDALKQLLTMYFDMAFLDIKMPGLNGIEVMTEYVRHAGGTSIVLMTGYRIEQVFTESCDSGEVTVFRTPVAAETFYSEVEQACKLGVALVANSEATLPAAVKDYFSMKGKRACVANSRSQVFDALDKEKPEILLLDFDQPITVSMSVFVELKHKSVSLPQIVVFMQHKFSDGDSLRSLPLTGCLFKPFKPENVLDVIQLEEDRREAFPQLN